MNKTFLKVLKYLGVASVGILFGIGILVGVSLLVGHDHNQNSAAKALKHRDAFVGYDSTEAKDFIQINYSDGDLITSNSITSTYNSVAVGSITNFVAYYSLNGVEYSFYPTQCYVYISNNVIQGVSLSNYPNQSQVWPNSYLNIGVTSWSLSISDYEHYPTNSRNLDYLKIMYSSNWVGSQNVVTSLNDFYNGVKSIIYNNTMLKFDKDFVNDLNFINVANYFNSLDVSYESSLEMKLAYSGVSPSMTSEAVEFYKNDSLSSGDEDIITFSLDEDSYFGLWRLNGAPSVFTEDIYLKVGNTDLYADLVEAYNNDISGLGLTYYDSFSFYQVFNYNAPYTGNLNSVFINDADFTSSMSPLIKKITYDLPYFRSNGQFFNRIEVIYTNAYGTRYRDINSNALSIKLCSSDGYGYFTHLQYVNTDTNFTKAVCFRNFSNYTDNNGDMQIYLDSGVSWVNTDYMQLKFLSVLSPSESNYLAQFNNNTTITGLGGYSGDIGLGEVFTLLSLAFQSWLPIFNIQIIPGVTIGLMLFLPLITGIIITIIWIVKR